MGNSRDKKLYNKTKYTLTGWFNTHYKRMQQRERVKFGRDLTFDRWDLEKWIIDNYYDEFATLFKNWTLNNYNSDDVPSIDRLDDSKGYSFDNMRIVTWRENREKEYATEKHKNVEQMITVTRVKVARIDKDGVKTIYQSMSDAGRENNISTSCICECCKGKRRSVKGYRWIYV